MKKVKICTPYITTPNQKGIILRETPKMIIVKVTGKTFESKSSNTLTSKFNKAQKDWHMEGFEPFDKRFWKDTLLEVGGTSRLIL